jgi:hypothetical protein
MPSPVHRPARRRGAQPNNGLHPTRDTTAFIFGKRMGGRGMRGGRRLYRVPE